MPACGLGARRARQPRARFIPDSLPPIPPRRPPGPNLDSVCDPLRSCRRAFQYLADVKVIFRKRYDFNNADSKGFCNSKEFAPIRRPMRSQAPAQKDGQRINESGISLFGRAQLRAAVIARRRHRREPSTDIMYHMIQNVPIFNTKILCRV